MIKYFVVIIALLTSLITKAHQDTIIEIDPNGNLSGLPDQYKPASLDTKNWVISIKDKKFKFPECVLEFFSETKIEKMLLTSSWYHGNYRGFNMPNYINILVEPNEFYIFISLDTVIPFGFNKEQREFLPLSKEQICEALNV